MQAYEQNLVMISLEAAEDLKRGELFYIDSNEKAAKCGAGEKIVGAIRADVDEGDTATCVVGGTVIVKSGAVVAAGAIIAADASGRAVTATTGNYPGGDSVQAAAAADNYFSVLLNPGQVVIPA